MESSDSGESLLDSVLFLGLFFVSDSDPEVSRSRFFDDFDFVADFLVL